MENNSLTSYLLWTKDMPCTLDLILPLTSYASQEAVITTSPTREQNIDGLITFPTSGRAGVQMVGFLPVKRDANQTLVNEKLSRRVGKNVDSWFHSERINESEADSGVWSLNYDSGGRITGSLWTTFWEALLWVKLPYTLCESLCIWCSFNTIFLLVNICTIYYKWSFSSVHMSMNSGHDCLTLSSLSNFYTPWNRTLKIILWTNEPKNAQKTLG